MTAAEGLRLQQLPITSRERDAAPLKRVPPTMRFQPANARRWRRRADYLFGVAQFLRCTSYLGSSHPRARVAGASPSVHHGPMTGSRESGGSADPVRLAELLDALATYRRARERLLHVLSLSMSNRDPLAEVSEHLVLALVGGTMAVTRRRRATI